MVEKGENEMEERLEYRLYIMQGDLEKLKYDYEMEYRKIDWMNHRANMNLSKVKTSGQVIITTILVMMAIYWVFVVKNGLQGSAGNYVFALLGGLMRDVAIFADILILLFVILPWSFALLKNFRMYLKSSDGYGSHLYSMIRKKDYQKDRRETETNIYAMSNRIIQMEFEIEQLVQQIEQQNKAVSIKEPTEGMFGKCIENHLDMMGADGSVNYEEEDIKYKSSVEIQSHLYHLESIERNLQKQYDREYSITRQIEERNTGQEHSIRKAVVMFCCGLGGVLISSAIKSINLITIRNNVIIYGAPILGVICVLVFVLPSAFIVGKELIFRYMNSEEFIGKEYIDKIKKASMSVEQVENEKALTEVSQKLARIQAEKEALEGVLREKLENEQKGSNLKTDLKL